MKLSFVLGVLPTLVLAGPYSLTTIIPWAPNISTSCDVSVILNGKYFLSDRGNAGVHVVDIASATQIGLLPGFVGLDYVNGVFIKDSSGPAGLVALPDRNELYVGDGNSSVKVFDLDTYALLAEIDFGLTKRADEMGYDPINQVVAVTAPDEPIPIIFFISATTRTVIANITFPEAYNGIELPNWNPTDGNWYNSIPETYQSPGGQIDVIDPKTFKVIKSYSEPKCNSAGTAWGAPNQLFLGCSQDPITNFNVSNTLIMDVTSGNITHTTKGIAGSDQVAYAPITNFFYASAYQNQAGGLSTGAATPQLAIIDAEDGRLMQVLVTDDVVAHAVAVDPISNRMFVPLLAGIGVYDFSMPQECKVSMSSKECKELKDKWHAEAEAEVEADEKNPGSIKI
jgi:hypothetical protein